MTSADNAFYGVPSPPSDLARHSAAVAGTACTAADAMAVTSNLIVHQVYARKLGLQLPPSRWEDEHVRSAARILDRVLAISPRPLRDPRAPDQRMIGNCQHAALLTCALLRAHGVAVRARAGFTPYLVPGEYGDHWICELLTPADGNGSTQMSACRQATPRLRRSSPAGKPGCSAGPAVPIQSCSGSSAGAAGGSSVTT